MRLLFIAVMLLCLPVLVIKAQDTKYISFKQEKVAYAPQMFYINDVADDRADKSIAGVINTGGGKSTKVLFKNGVAPALEAFISQDISQNKTKQAVTLHIKKLETNIKKEGAVWEVNAAVTFAFYISGKEVIEYASTGKGKMNKDPEAYIEKFIRGNLTANIKAFDKWCVQNKAKLAANPVAKVNVVIGRTSDMPNCFVYTAQKPLQIKDFTGPDEGKELELAATYSGVSMYYSAQTHNDQLTINVTVAAYFDKGRSWFKEKGKTPKVLAHEQTHFDITALEACALADTIRKTTFTEADYQKLLEQLRQDNLQKLNDEQAKYDEETRHGNIMDKQEMWQNSIKEKIKSSGCY